LTVEHERYLEHLRADTEALLAAAAVDLTRSVPTCPDWTVADLLWHVGCVHDRWRRIAEGITDEAAARAVEEPPRPADDELPALVRGQAERLIAVLADVDPGAPRWNWTSGPQTAAFIPRRMAHETAVHRVDAERAAGQAAPIDARLAADGIDELLAVLLPARDPYRGPAGFVGVAETDTGRAWAVRLEPPTAELVSPMRVPKRAQPLEQLVGGAEEVLLTLWGREPRRRHGPLTTALLDHLEHG
jgi:uncharacterized protein (TIGR03083 family)